MKHLDLFSGIGGFALAAQTVWGGDYENVGKKSAKYEVRGTKYEEKKD